MTFDRLRDCVIIAVLIAAIVLITHDLGNLLKDGGRKPMALAPVDTVHLPPESPTARVSRTPVERSAVAAIVKCPRTHAHACLLILSAVNR